MRTQPYAQVRSRVSYMARIKRQTNFKLPRLDLQAGRRLQR